MKKLIVLICFVMVMSLCACGAKTQPSPTAAPTAAPTEVPATEVPAEAPTEETAIPDSFDPSSAGSVLMYYGSRGSEIFGSYAFMQLDKEGMKTWTAPLNGIQEFKVPESFLSAKGGIRAVGGYESIPGSGIVYMSVVYLPYTEAEYDTFLDWIAEFSKDHPNPTAEDVEAYRARVEEYHNNAYPLFYIMGIDKNGTAEDLKTRLKKAYLDDGIPEEDIDGFLDSITMIIDAGSAEDFNFYLVKRGRVSDSFTESQADYKEEYDTLYDAAESFASNFTFMRPLGLTQLVSEGTGLTFETKDLNDNPVNSSELFGSHKATMLNIWETTCSACMSEMPDLIKMAKEFEAKGGQIVGLVYDATEDDLIEEAKEISADLGLNFVNLLPTQEIKDFFMIQAYPTTYFLNEKGEVIGAPIIGANPEGYISRMNELLENK